MRLHYSIIEARSNVLGYAIEARKQRFPEEQPSEDKLHKDEDDAFVWNASMLNQLKDCNLRDLSI